VKVDVLLLKVDVLLVVKVDVLLVKVDVLVVKVDVLMAVEWRGKRFREHAALDRQLPVAGSRDGENSDLLSLQLH